MGSGTAAAIRYGSSDSLGIFLIAARTGGSIAGGFGLASDAIHIEDFPREELDHAKIGNAVDAGGDVDVLGRRFGVCRTLAVPRPAIVLRIHKRLVLVRRMLYHVLHVHVYL
jgi:hypothetical protein